MPLPPAFVQFLLNVEKLCTEAVPFITSLHNHLPSLAHKATQQQTKRALIKFLRKRKLSCLAFFHLNLSCSPKQLLIFHEWNGMYKNSKVSWTNQTAGSWFFCLSKYIRWYHSVDKSDCYNKNTSWVYIPRRTESRYLYSTGICTPIFTEALFNSQKVKATKCPPTDEWINKMWNNHWNITQP